MTDANPSGPNPTTQDAAAASTPETGGAVPVTDAAGTLDTGGAGAAGMSGAEAKRAEFRAFLSNMPVKLGSFVEAVLPRSITIGEDGAEKEFRKDFSPASLPWVEAFALTRFPSPAAVAAAENQPFSEGLIRYLGETLLRTVGGTWDIDPEGGVGHGMPFIRPDTPAGEAAGEPISLVSLLMTAVQERRGDTFVTALANALAEFGEQGMPNRTSTGIDLSAGGERPSQLEQDHLDAFLGGVEPVIAAWIHEQGGGMEAWAYGRPALERLTADLRERYSDAEAMAGQDEQSYLAGAVRYAGEVIRRAGLGTWRFGAEAPADDPRSGQPFVRFAAGDGAGADGADADGFDVVPWQLVQDALTDGDALTTAYDRAAATV